MISPGHPQASRITDMNLVLDLTNQMKDLAKEGEWLAMAELEAKRKQVIQEFFSNPIPPDQTAKVRTSIEEILQIDQEILEAGRSARDIISKQLNDFAQNRQAHKAYSSNTENP